MRFSAFEQAAAEASYGMHEIDTQLEQLRGQLEQIKVQMVQLQSKRNLLDKLSQELLQLKPERMAPTQPTFAPAPAAGVDRAEAPPQPVEPPRTLRETWATPAPEIPDKLPLESILRARG
ncbi:MAG TPA: hypothetical protein VGS02_00850 [Acidobacteriaceae bacterium]|nr:hypothetical protein [Acidobacteriaceae bacterium]